MRKLFLIASLVLLCCCGRVKTVSPVLNETPHRAALDAVDTLLQQQPDSALAVMLDFALDKQQLLDLRLAADRHFNQFTVRLKQAYPKLTNGDLDYCCLYLLGLTDADIAALMQRTYNTVFERNGKMRKIFDSENPLPATLMGFAKKSSFD